jgi:hypothetical protein
LLPFNVCANPAYWPFFVSDIPLASDISTAVALASLALGCYVMARCFDVPVLPSILAAQLVIVLFGPLVRIILLFYQVFWINPGTAHQSRAVTRPVRIKSWWSLPIPIYVEHSLFPLFTAAAVVGYWACPGPS